MQASRILGLATLIALVAASVAAGATAKKVTLTVGVSGEGSVSSTPAGISCKPKCALRVKKGTKVTLTATANNDSEFTHWSPPCGTANTCTVKMTAARAVHAYFMAPPLAPPPPPPPPAPEAGHYVGTYSDGTFFNFDLSGSSITNINFDYNGECPNGYTIGGGVAALTGSYTVNPDGTFTASGSVTFSDQVDSFDGAGTVTTSGTANGTMHVTVDFTDGTQCTSTGTWMAQLGS